MIGFSEMEFFKHSEDMKCLRICPSTDGNPFLKRVLERMVPGRKDGHVAMATMACSVHTTAVLHSIPGKKGLVLAGFSVHIRINVLTRG
jgi:hypothetical protein